MLPSDGLILEHRAPGLFEGGRSEVVLLHLDHESGGVAVADNSQGLLYQTWVARISDDRTQILVSAPEVTEFVAYIGNNITEVSLTFDQNMRLCFCFVEDGSTKLYWYDLIVNSFIVTDFGTDFKSPKVSLDDKEEVSGSDIIFAYIRDHMLRYRLQRDRYQTEYTVSDRLVRRIHKIGMGVNGRFQFVCIN